MAVSGGKDVKLEASLLILCTRSRATGVCMSSMKRASGTGTRPWPNGSTTARDIMHQLSKNASHSRHGRHSLLQDSNRQDPQRNSPRGPPSASRRRRKSSPAPLRDADGNEDGGVGTGVLSVPTGDHSSRQRQANVSPES